MALSAIQAYALAKKYTDDSLAGGGAVAGKNCTIESIEPITGGNRITFQWTLDNGTIKTDTLDVMDGVDGADGEDGNGIASIAKTSTSGLVDTYTITFTDGNTETFTVTNGQDGENAQYSTLPEASASNVGQIVQYVGDTTSTLTNGFFYKCVEDSGSYSWVQKNVQAGGGGGTGDYDELSNRPKINDVTLTGNKTSSDLGLASASALADKVDKVTGKGLSTNDYDDTAKGIVDGVTTALDGKVDKVTGKDLSTNDYTDADKAIVDGVTTALAGKISITEKGSNGGVAELDANGRVPSAQLPSYVDDVIEYEDLAHFPATGETGKIYIALDTNKTYRWSGTEYVEISQSLALGETSSTAYAGNKGKANADAIAAIKDGNNIDSFADVETALAGKQDKIVVTATIANGEDSVDITNASITANSVFDIYTEDNSLYWTNITISGTTATITFDKSVTQATAVKVFIR